MQQVAVGAMQFDRIDAQPIGAPRRLDECIAKPLEPHEIELERLHLAVLVLNGRWRNRLPSALSEGNLLTSLPGLVARSLAAGMGQLDCAFNRRMAGERGG